MGDPYKVDPDAEFLLPMEARALRRMIEKADSYEAQGRTQEAWGARRVIGYLWVELASLEDPEGTTGIIEL